MGIRPIISMVNLPMANMAKFLDIYLQPIMKQLPAYLKDTTQFANKISEIPVESSTWLVTVNIRVWTQHSKRQRHTGNCNTSQVIYLIQCRQCGRQYVAQTAQSLRARVAKHLTAIRNRHQHGVLHEHYRRGDCAGTNNNMSVQFLDIITSKEGDTTEHIEQQLKKTQIPMDEQTPP